VFAESHDTIADGPSGNWERLPGRQLGGRCLGTGDPARIALCRL